MKYSIHDRKKTRKLLFQKLYARSYGPFDELTFRESFFDGVFDFTIDEPYITEMYDGIISKQGVLGYIFSYYAPRFDIHDMNACYFLPVFIGCYEMLYLSEEIPGKVSLNEAIELAKVYSDDSGKKVVNGVMNSLYKNFDSLEELVNNYEGGEHEKYIFFPK